MSGADRERLLDLLADEACGELDEAGRSELARLVAGGPALDADLFQRAAAAVQLTTLDDVDPLPDRLKERLASDAAEYLRDRAFSNGSRRGPTPASSTPAPHRGGLLASPWSGWLAAAAVLILSLVLRDERAPAADPVAARSALLARAGGAIELPWTSTEDELGRGVSGDVVWDGARQTGFMRFRGLAANDPSRNQYQLWIFDEERPDTTPVDGGVFDVPAGADEIVVPIHAKLEVSSPTLFAVTLERPGGVVVSEREHLLALAPVP